MESWKELLLRPSQPTLKKRKISSINMKIKDVELLAGNVFERYIFDNKN